MTDTATSTKVAGTPSMGWGWMLAAGIAILLLGLFLLGYPTASSVAVTLFLGWVLIIGGVFTAISAIMNRASGGLWTGLILGVFSLVAGFLLVFNPLVGTVTLTMVFTLWLLADGIVGSVLSIVRREPGWGWWLASSLIALVLGLMLLNNWPSATFWLLGIYAGILLIFRGLMLVFLSFEVRRLSRA